MRKIVWCLAVCVLASSAVAVTCKPGKSKPCGKACISLTRVCHKTPTPTAETKKGGETSEQQ
jgi:hypothetical protein